jgi:hypothetical protein
LLLFFYYGIDRVRLALHMDEVIWLSSGLLVVWIVANEWTRARLTDSVFLSYRRHDEASFANWLHRELTTVLPGYAVFCDEHALSAGDNVEKRILDAIHRCRVLVVVVGNRWYGELTNLSAAGKRDWVKDEIGEAAHSCKEVQAVLVDNAALPRPPWPSADDVREALSRRKFLPIRSSHFKEDSRQLWKLLDRLVRIERMRRWLVGILIVLGGAGIAYIAKQPGVSTSLEDHIQKVIAARGDGRFDEYAALMTGTPVRWKGRVVSSGNGHYTTIETDNAQVGEGYQIWVEFIDQTEVQRRLSPKDVIEFAGTVTLVMPGYTKVRKGKLVEAP